MRQITLRPVADVSNTTWVLFPGGGTITDHIDDDVDSHNGDDDYIRSSDVGDSCKVRLSPLPDDLKEIIQVTVKAVVGSDVPVDCSAEIGASLYVDNVAKSRDLVALFGGRWYSVEFTGADWLAVTGQTLELGFDNNSVQSDPPSLGLRVYITAVEVRLVYEQK